MGTKLGLPRIGVFTKQLDNWRSGSGHHLNEIMARVLDLNQGTFDFTFMHYAPSENPVYRRVRELIVPRNPVAFAALLRRERFDVVHYTPLTVYAPIWLVPNRKVATIHGVEQLLLPHLYGRLEMLHERFLVPLYARRMDGIVTVSETTKSYLVERFGVRSDRVTVVYNGLGGDYRRIDNPSPRLPASFPSGSPFVFHISRFSERKNPWILLEAFSRFIASRASDYVLICAGKGWDSPEVATRARSLGIGDRFYAPGFITNVEAANYLSAARMFVFPSLAEGFGMPNVEAMACGCPVVTTASFAVPEIVGDAALVVQDPKDAIALAEAMARLDGDHELRSLLIAKGYEHCKRFTWDGAARKLLDLYRSLS